MSGKSLVICEKPSVAREVASALGARRVGSHYECGRWVVCALLGHVAELKKPSAYQRWESWDLGALPMVPAEFELVAADGEATERCLSELRSLLDRKDVSEVVHACDPDREGEGIARRALALLGCKLPVRRLWCSSLEPGAIADALASMRPDSDYDGLGDAAWGRAVADWLVGMNLTRACTLHAAWRGRTVHVGRVLTPTLRLVCDRTRARAGHKSVPFWEVRAKVAGGVELSSERYASREAAEAALASMAGQPLAVTRLERRRRRVAAPLPYDLTGAQRDASRWFGMSAKQALDALQALYEARLATYPRTDSTHVSSADAPTVAVLVSSPDVMGAAGLAPLANADVSRIVDDSQVGGHPALLPTRELTGEAMAGLSEDQARMARLVTVRLACSLMPDGSDDVCRIEGTCAGVALSATVSEAAVAGWREARDAALGRPPRDKDGQDPREAEGRVPEEVREGSELELSESCLHEGKTRPPAAYTDATLLSAMEGAARLVDDAGAARALRGSESHAGGLGTPATRADTIERLESYGYVSRDGKSLAATELGLAVDSLVPEAVATPALTGRWEEDLARVEAGALPVSDFEASVASTLPGLVSDALAHPVPPCPDTLGTCPRCGRGSVVLSKSGKVAYCDTRRGHMEDGSFVVDSEGCGYRLSPSVFGHRMTETQLRQLLSSGRVALRGVTTPKGAHVSAVLVDANAEWGTRLEFASRPGPRRGGRGHGNR